MSSNTLDPGSMNNKSTLEGFFDALLHYFWHLFDLPLTPFFCYRTFVSSLPLSFKLLVFGSKLLLNLMLSIRKSIVGQRRFFYYYRTKYLFNMACMSKLVKGIHT